MSCDTYTRVAQPCDITSGAHPKWPSKMAICACPHHCATLFTSNAHSCITCRVHVILTIDSAQVPLYIFDMAHMNHGVHIWISMHHSTIAIVHFCRDHMCWPHACVYKNPSFPQYEPPLTFVFIPHKLNRIYKQYANAISHCCASYAQL